MEKILNTDIYLAFYRKDHSNAMEADGMGALHIMGSDISGGYNGLMDALSAATAAIKCSGVNYMQCCIVNSDKTRVMDPIDVSDEFKTGAEFWHNVAAYKLMEEIDEYMTKKYGIGAYDMDINNISALQNAVACNMCAHDICEMYADKRGLTALDEWDEPQPRHAVTTDTLEALKAAERFIAGFEGDETQEGIDALLLQIRNVIGGY